MSGGLLHPVAEAALECLVGSLGPQLQIDESGLAGACAQLTSLIEDPSRKGEVDRALRNLGSIAGSLKGKGAAKPAAAIFGLIADAEAAMEAQKKKAQLDRRAVADRRDREFRRFIGGQDPDRRVDRPEATVLTANDLRIRSAIASGRQVMVCHFAPPQRQRQQPSTPTTEVKLVNGRGLG